jgi:hypothetical protein
MLEACPEFIEGIGYRLAEKFMKQKFLARFLSFHSDNPKSAIQNPKWVVGRLGAGERMPLLPRNCKSYESCNRVTVGAAPTGRRSD